MTVPDGVLTAARLTPHKTRTGAVVLPVLTSALLLIMIAPGFWLLAVEAAVPAGRTA